MEHKGSDFPSLGQRQVVANAQQLTTQQIAQQTLSQAEVMMMEYWDRRLGGREGDYPLLPTAYRNRSIPMTPRLYEETLRQTGFWMDSYMRRCIEALIAETKDRLRQRRHDPVGISSTQPVLAGSVCLHFGIGVGRGMEYLRDAFNVGLELELYDWSEVALRRGRVELTRILERHPDALDLESMVQWAEITRFFSSEHWQENARFVRIAQLAFILEHLEMAQLESVVLGAGRMLGDHHNQLVVMDTPIQGNEQFASTTSKRRDEGWMRGFLAETLARGAGERVVCFDSQEFVNPAGQRLVAWTFRST